ncbi:hypothetical protein BST81_17850 [Leptolyngbya sp. 'hensonii']|uniref:AAA-like domain-containing protein n=1 Tax=Leptolyngbya sp. 'hensonii' TaxID=1922337 RepID=UPI00095031E8|nr:AAA-like domain-containing protein [Leptolyngbya sp. 'hensonii']OLP17211.1 hypothetical protein BST81_17850 [Leptolyngbya sp. 'hensonii']
MNNLIQGLQNGHILQPGDTLKGRYEVIRQIGGGGFGQTFLAIDHDLPSQPIVVVKQLKPKQNNPANLEIARRLFDREACILDQLGQAHDQIPELLAYFEQNGEFYLVQDYIEGQTLEQELQAEQKMPQYRATELLHDILQVLAFVHDQGVIHRDIKPANLIRRRADQKIVLIDFGAVKEVRQQGDDNNKNDLTVSIESRGYTPPEQLEGHPNPSSDVYAVGMLIIQALTGLAPTQLPRDPIMRECSFSSLSQDFSINFGLLEILNKMIRRNDYQRYQNAREALEAVQRLMNESSYPTRVSCPSDTGRELRTTSTGESPCKADPCEPTPSDSPLYIDQPIEIACCQEISRQAGFVRIKGPLDTGKTTLMGRIIHYAERQGYQVIALSLSLFDDSAHTDLNQFLRQFCFCLGDEFEIASESIDESWNEKRFSPLINCKRFFEKFLLPTCDRPLVLGLDDVDEIFPNHRVAKEFLKFLRTCHEDAKTKKLWSHLRLIMAYSTDVYIVMDTTSSPFNVGLEVALPEFTTAQVIQLAARHGLLLATDQITQVMDMTGGHPYLVRVLLHHLACRKAPLTDLLKHAPTESGIYGDHLRRHLHNLKEHPELSTAIQAVMTQTEPVRLDPELAFKLNGLGLIHLQGNEVVSRCELYRQYFLDRLLKPT